MGPEANEIAEFQGFYGPFTVPEKLLQKIWLRRDFDDSQLRTISGERVEILFPGKWNLLGGPDFRGARLRMEGREVTGDVELHFHAVDWMRHRHHEDPAYDSVVLHVLLFPPPDGATPACTSAGRPLAALVLLDLLYHDLEEYAAEDALEAILERNHWQVTERLLLLPPEERRELLVEHARRRWEQKLHFAGLRIKRLGWEEACHQTALEILGYRRNRSSMLNVASRFPYAQWRVEAPDETASLAAGAPWHFQGARPANRPVERLRQYSAWMASRPDWPGRLRAGVNNPCGISELSAGGVAGWRKHCALARRRPSWSRDITGGAVAASRFDTLMCDGFLPLAAAAGVDHLFPLWLAWYPGDFPERVGQTLRATDVLDRRMWPASNGFAQGVLSLSLEQHGDPLACFEPDEAKPV